VTDRLHVERNAASRERLARLLASLTEPDYDRELADGWSVGSLLVHVALWDRLVAQRWAHARTIGARTPAELTPETSDLVNDAALPILRSIPAPAVRELVVRAAADVDELVASLRDDVVDAIAAEGRPRLLDRSLHRGQHLEAIEGALGGASPA
jgi:hypothetical protein